MYKRGDIVAVHFPFSDGSSSKLRPALVLSNNSIENTGDIILVMITSVNRDSNNTIELTPEKVIDKLPKVSFVKCHRLFAIERTLILGKISSVTEVCMQEVLKSIIQIIS